MIKNSKKMNPLKFLCQFFALSLMCVVSAPTVFAADLPDFTPENPDTITLSVPDLPDLEIYVDGVFDEFEYLFPYDGEEEGGDPHVSSSPTYRIFVQDGAEVSFNQSITCRLVDQQGYKTTEIKKGELTILKEGQELILFIYEDGSFVTEDFATAPLGLQIEIVVPDDETWIQGELFYIDNIQIEELSLPEPPPTINIASPKTVRVAVDGKEINLSAYTIGDEDYFRLRDLAMALSGTKAGFDVRWIAESSSIELSRGETYTPAGGELQIEGSIEKDAVERTLDADILLDGAWIALPGYTIDYHNYFKMDDLAYIFDFGVFWDDNPDDTKVSIDTSSSYWFPLRGDSAVEGEEVVEIILSSLANVGYWEFTDCMEGVVQELDYSEYIDAQYSEWLEQSEDNGEDMAYIPDVVAPGNFAFLFAGEKLGETELRFVYRAGDLESMASEPMARAVYRIKVFEDKTIAIIAQADEILYPALDENAQIEDDLLD